MRIKENQRVMLRHIGHGSHLKKYQIENNKTANVTSITFEAVTP